MEFTTFDKMYIGQELSHIGFLVLKTKDWNFTIFMLIFVMF